MRAHKNDEKRANVAQAIIPLKALLFRLSLLFLIILSLGIIVISKFDNALTDGLRTKTVDAVVPVLSALSSPVAAYGSIKESLHNLFFIYQENRRLRNENMQLSRVQAVAIELEAENKRLKNLLNYLPEKGGSFMTARVVGDTGGPYGKTVLINSGKNSGVKKGQIVTNSKGLVGRVFKVGNNSTRILLISDLASRVPVITEISRERALLTGDNDNMPKLNHLPHNSKVAIGEKVVTSGDGEFFPAEIPVGIIHSISGKTVTVEPLVDWGRLEYITITDYND